MLYKITAVTLMEYYKLVNSLPPGHVHQQSESDFTLYVTLESFQVEYYRECFSVVIEELTEMPGLSPEEDIWTHHLVDGSAADSAIEFLKNNKHLFES